MVNTAGLVTLLDSKNLSVTSEPALRA